ncbi:alpha-galactosidase [Paenibacillus antri]|uniref:Alpha-galactosidase n=1 Tax=Paenibacillus antri TaxID=2582848 RepID=A0A5R9FYG1_9BACL|nr:alpha-galactosidase [Paenibacillus antri]TLS49087.1 alpha-galactosidase [Paenibacillus antri]
MVQAKAGSIQVIREADFFTVDNGLIAVVSDLAHGALTIRWQGGAALEGLFSETAYRSGVARTTHYGSHRVDEASIEDIDDVFGRGIAWAVEHTSAARVGEVAPPVLRQRFRLYDGQPYCLVELEAVCETEWETGEMAPLAALRNDGSILKPGDAETDDREELRILFVPYDNDKWVRYGSYPIPGSVESYEATAIYGANSRRGIVLGSVRHDFWKTGIRAEGTFAGELTRLRVFGGVSGLHTRDTLPHGAAKGLVNVSPLIFVGAYDDYRTGMEAFGRANAALVPALPWDGGVPFGWNSWSAVMSKLDLDVYAHTSDFLRDELLDGGFHGDDGAVYVNFDAFWNHLPAGELEEAVRRAKANGQKPGIYFSPFAYWGKDPERPVEGFEGQYVYRDILLKDDAGRLLPTLDGAYAIDLSHPIALERIRKELQNFVDWGFDYAKADFLSHGAMEGRHYDPEIRTGVQAYHLGMRTIRDALAPEKIGRPFLINLSIAPLFPHGYAHSRRVSCDAFGLIGDTEYMLNAVSHGWWINDALYRFNDPDHTVLYKSANQRATTEQEGRSRLTASVIAGTSLLLGDDYRQEEAARRAREWMTHPAVMALARLGRTFRPAGRPSGSKASDVFTLRTGEEHWIAAFNYDPNAGVRKEFSFEELGISQTGALSIVDVWSGAEQSIGADARCLVELEPAEAKLLRIRNQ